MEPKEKRHILTGGMILITLGVLIILNNTTAYRFGMSWPILLIVVAIGTLVQRVKDIGGWIIGVAADSDVKEAALDFAAFMAAPDMVKKLAVTGGTGINPARFSQFEALDLWTQAGFDEASATDYLDAILSGINDPNAVLDLRITGSAEYLQTLDVEIARAIAGEASPQEAMDNVAAQWNEISDRLGREAQLAQYQSAVGYQAP